MNTVAAKGAWGTIEWATAARGGAPALEFLLGLVADEQADLDLFQRLAETGKISNREKFKSLGTQGLGLFEFKAFQLRFLGDFRPGRRFVVAIGLRKKKDDLNRRDIENAVRILRENDAAK